MKEAVIDKLCAVFGYLLGILAVGVVAAQRAWHYLHLPKPEPVPDVVRYTVNLYNPRVVLEYDEPTWDELFSMNGWVVRQQDPGITINVRHLDPEALRLLYGGAV